MRFACVHFVLLGACDHGAANGAANVAALGGRSKPERWYLRRLRRESCCWGE